MLIEETKTGFSILDCKEAIDKSAAVNERIPFEIDEGRRVIRSVFFTVVVAMNVLDYGFHYHPPAQIEPCS